ncbi:hypothetical protein CLHOM_17390 [Clostridium homopropionicum DSM 5847]|uniref:Uncharacterized protein n=2 Tax=Clostridium TaxID=1485 RepID=A0A0L6Z9K8_9CLOT|nr:hypothetical protein [Clostridium homopropionicum]KOA19650.1 hypothetical protein CLHOM_17390 [Clostridium homopropionicum DSM 5847]SFF80912.1 hypothetical protein SAMN04488501_102255 [Clostridium homopropionicum]
MLLVILFTGCSQQISPVDKDVQKHVEIDWINFIQVNDIHYSDVHNYCGRDLTSADIGQKVSEVKFKVSDNVFDTSYKTKDGDAAFLEKGTPIYSIKGYRTEFRLAAYFNGKLTLYEAHYNPKAKIGGDLIDIRDKVKYIGINSEQDGRTELAAIKDDNIVKTMVDNVLSADIVDMKNYDLGGTRYFIAFHLKDETAITYSYWVNSRYLALGVECPLEFQNEIDKAINKMKK